jgi:hypothetical protein
MTDRQVLAEIEGLKSLVEELEISSIEDIPELDDLTEKFQTGDATLKDAWFAKLYKNGLDIADDVIDAPEMGDLKELASQMEERFVSRLDTKPEPGAIAKQVKAMKEGFSKQGVNDILGQFYSDNMFKKDFNKKNVEALQNSVKEVKLGLGFKTQVKSKIFKSIPTDEMVRKVISGIANIPDQETKRLVLLGLFGTRGAQINDLGSDIKFAEKRKRPFYDRESGEMIGGQGKGRKKLAARVPFGPLMKDIMDYQYDQATDGGKNLNRSVFSKKVNLGNIINKYLFNRNGKLVLTDGELAKLGRTSIGGFTDLRRMMLSWAADKSGERELASELLTHGSEADMDKSVTGRFYIPGKGTDIDALRRFTTGIEQNLAKISGHENYKSFMDALNVEAYTTETNKVKNFTDKVIVKQPETDVVQGNVTKTVEITKSAKDIAREAEAESSLKVTETVIADELKIKEGAKKLGISEDEMRQRIADKTKKGPKKKKTVVPATDTSWFQTIIDEEGLDVDIKTLEGKSWKEINKILETARAKTSVKPEGQARVAEPEMKTPFLDIEGAGGVTTVDMEKAGRVIDPLVDVVTSLPAGRVAKAAVTIGKGLGKALKPDIKDPVERFDILEPLPKKEEKETTEERTRGQVNNLFDFPLGP